MVCPTFPSRLNLRRFGFGIAASSLVARVCGVLWRTAWWNAIEVRPRQPSLRRRCREASI